MRKLTFKLNEARPDSLKIKQLGEYLKKLGDLYGSADTLFLDSVEEGSACLNFMVDDNHAAQVLGRVLDASQGRGPKTYINAYKRVLRLVDKDQYSGEILMDDKSVITLPVRPERSSPPPIEQRMPTSVKGKIYRVGGTDDTVPVRLTSVDGEIVYAETSIELSKELGAHLYQHIHAHGEGLWVSEKAGQWRLAKIKIDSYEVIEHLNAGEALRALKKIGGWKEEPPEQMHANILDYRR